MITRIITSFALFLLPLFGAAQCQVSFTYTSNGTTFMFDGTVSPTPAPSTQYYWWFSDNSSSATVQDPTHTFIGPGTYTVCFSVFDQINQCFDSICQTVVVAGGCNADFVSYDSLGTAYFVSTTTAPQPAIYFWDFGDGNYGTQQNPIHTYANPGTYLACLTVYDSLQNFCDSTCHYVTIQGQSGCSASFTSIDSMGYVFFISTSTLGAGGYYYWDFGDGNYSTAQNPSHVYSSPGTYMVCLTVYDSMQNFCDSTCHSIVVNAVGVTESNLLSTSLNAAPNPADGNLNVSFLAASAGSANIVFFDASGRIAAEENFNIHSSGHNTVNINTANLSQGIYLVKIVANNSEAWTRVAITHQ